MLKAAVKSLEARGYAGALLAAEVKKKKENTIDKQTNNLFSFTARWR